MSINMSIPPPPPPPPPKKKKKKDAKTSNELGLKLKMTFPPNFAFNEGHDL